MKEIILNKFQNHTGYYTSSVANCLLFIGGASMSFASSCEFYNDDGYGVLSDDCIYKFTKRDGLIIETTNVSVTIFLNISNTMLSINELVLFDKNGEMISHAL